VEPHIVNALKLATVRTVYSIGVFLLIAAGWGYITAASDPGHAPGSQLTMVVVGAVMAVLGRYLRIRFWPGDRVPPR
jgi:hypothetical protein